MATSGKQKSEPRKLGYKQQRELNALPEQIEALELAIKELEEETGGQDFYSRPYAQTQPVLDELKQSQHRLEKLTSRWLELEDLQKAFIDTKNRERQKNIRD